MLPSSPKPGTKGAFESLNPALIRGLYLIWRSEIRRDGSAEIRELDHSGKIKVFADRTLGNSRVFAESQPV